MVLQRQLEARESLADLVVQLPGDAPALALLGLDDHAGVPLETLAEPPLKIAGGLQLVLYFGVSDRVARRLATARRK